MSADKDACPISFTLTYPNGGISNVKNYHIPQHGQFIHLKRATNIKFISILCTHRAKNYPRHKKSKTEKNMALEQYHIPIQRW